MSVALDQALDHALDQIPAPNDASSAHARRPARPMGAPPYRGARVPRRHAHAVDPKAGAGQGCVAFYGGGAYERLVAQGYLDSRPFAALAFTCANVWPRPCPASGVRALRPRRPRIRSTSSGCCATCCRRLTRPERGPGLGYLPSRWLDGELITGAPAHARPAKRRANARLRHAARLPAATPAVADAVLEELEIWRVAGSSRARLGDYPGHRSDRAHFRAAG